MIYTGRNSNALPPLKAVERRRMSEMTLLDLTTEQHPSPVMDRLPESPNHMDHHDLLVDVLREELEDTIRELRALVTSRDPRS